MKKFKIDPITAEVVYNALQSIAERMGVALVRSSYSTNIKERKDCSCAIFDSKGHLVVLAEHIPIHLGSMQGLIKNLVRNLETWNLGPGDVIIANDPYKGGGTHLPDVTLVRPVYHQESLIAFVSNIAHWSDVGGRTPGVGTAGDSTELFQEGLRIPPTLILNRDQVRDDLLELLLVNMRNPEERLGDFLAQIASLRLGERDLLKLYSRYNNDTISKCISEQFNYSERRLQTAITKIPEGTYDFTDAMDDDGVRSESIPINVTIKILHGSSPSIEFDFSGTAAQVSGGINMVWQALEATILYSVKAIFAHDVPVNAGFQRPIHIKAARGSLVNAQENAAVGGRTDTCQRVVDTIMGAIGKIAPELVVAASNGATTAIIFGGTRNLTGKDFVYVEALGGGMGARFNKDGMDGVQVHITNTSNLPIEAMELEYPLRVVQYGLIPDNGGAGKFRGGLPIQKDIQVLKPIIFSAHSDRHKIPPWGFMGGAAGECGKFILNPEMPNKEILPSKTSGVLLKSGDVIRIKTAGGGGFGSALERNPDYVLRDYVLGKISLEEAYRKYRVVLTEQGLDIKATKDLRQHTRSKREE
jgi:N-methylhydantoinase B